MARTNPQGRSAPVLPSINGGADTASRSAIPRGVLSLKGLERDDRPGVLNARDGLHLFVDEMADVGAVLDIELHQQVEVTGGRVNLGCDLGVGKRVGYRI